jgi:hypothetical protein
MQQKPLVIIDLYGLSITVNDLEKAIGQAALFITYRHVDKSYAAFDAKMNQYWRHIYDQLIALRVRNP